MKESQSKNPSMQEGEFRTCREIAAILKISEITVRKLLTQKKLHRYKVGGRRGRTLIRLDEALGLICAE